MAPFPALRRWTLAAGAAFGFAAVVGVQALQRSPADVAPSKVDAATDETRSWPMMGGGNARNMVNLIEKDMPTTWNVKKGAETNVKWSVQLGTKAYGGPVIAGGKIFVGTNNNVPRNKRDEDADGDPIDKSVLMCFRESDGAFLWQYVSDKLPAGRENDWPDQGICSSPVVEGDRLYFVTNRAEVVCLTTGGLAAGNVGVTDEKYKDKTDGDVVWRLDMIDKLGVFPHNLAVCSPLIAGDTLFVVTGNGVDKDHKKIPAPDAPSFLAIDKKTGKVLWKDSSPGKDILHGQWAQPSYAAPNGKPMVLFPGGDGWLRGFDPKDGTLLWKFDCNPKNAVYMLGPASTRNDFVWCAPVVHDDRAYIGVGQDPEHKGGVGHLWCIDITKTPKNEDKDLSPAARPPAKPGDLPETLFDPKDPANKDSGLVWHFGGYTPPGSDRPYFFGRTMSTCAVHDGLVYAAEMEGYLHCLDAKTGEEYWQHKLKGYTWSSPYWVDGKIYLGDDRGDVTVFKRGKTKEILGRADFGRGSLVRVTPVACNGVLYVMSENPCKLWAIVNK